MALGLRAPARPEGRARRLTDRSPHAGLPDPARPPWRAGVPPARGALPAAELAEPVEHVARSLLGTLLVSTTDGVRTSGVVVETEAYGGPDDPASHAAVRAGRTRRNATMFAAAGHAYVYRSYGIHWCVNVVTGPADHPQAVLLRGLDAWEGVEHQVARRSGRRPLAAGPGRLCEALGITGSLDGHPLDRPPLVLERGWTVPDRAVAVSGRIGVRRAADWPLRFYVRGAPGVSRRTAPLPERG